MDRREVKCAAIYGAALKVFAEYGFRKATIEDIAGELGVAKSSLYFYVSDKRDLYDKAVAHGFRAWQNKVREAVAAEPDLKKKLSVMTGTAFEALEEDPCLRRILKHDPGLFPLIPSQDPYSEINRDSLEMLKKLLAQGIKEKLFREVDIETLAPLLFSIYVMLIQKAYLFPEGDFTRAMLDNGLDLILDGLLLK